MVDVPYVHSLVAVCETKNKALAKTVNGNLSHLHGDDKGLSSAGSCLLMSIKTSCLQSDTASPGNSG